MSDECAMAEGRERERADVLALLDVEITRTFERAAKSTWFAAAVLQRVRAMIAHGNHETRGHAPRVARLVTPHCVNTDQCRERGRKP